MPPWKAPWRNSAFMKALTFILICAQSGSSLDSNAAHCVPRKSDCSRWSARRRTGTYLYSEAKWSVP